MREPSPQEQQQPQHGMREPSPQGSTGSSAGGANAVWQARRAGGPSELPRDQPLSLGQQVAVARSLAEAKREAVEAEFAEEMAAAGEAPPWMRGMPMGDRRRMGGTPMGGRQRMGGMPMGGPHMMRGMPMGGRQRMGGMPMGGPHMMRGMPMGGQQMGGMPMGGPQMMRGMPMGGQQMGGMPMGGPQMMRGMPMGGRQMGGMPMGGPLGEEAPWIEPEDAWEWEAMQAGMPPNAGMGGSRGMEAYGGMAGSPGSPRKNAWQRRQADAEEKRRADAETLERSPEQFGAKAARRRQGYTGSSQVRIPGH